MSYVELHLHTCYSFLEGASRPEELVVRAAELGYGALAVTDHDGLYGAMEFAQVCAALEVQPITGVELTLRHGLHAPDSGPVHLTLLAENGRGYANLCRLITEAWRGTRLHPAFLQGRTEGLIALSGCRSGEVARLVDAGRLDEALEAAQRLAELFGVDNTFVELQHNLVKGDSGRVARLAELAKRIGLGVVATGNVHYHVRERHRLQDAMVAIRHRTTLEASHRLRRANSEFFLRSPHEMAERFAAYPEAIANTRLIAERCRAFDLRKPEALGYEFPAFKGADGVASGESAEVASGEWRVASEGADEVLADYCWKRFEGRYPAGQTDPSLREQAHKQLAEELKLVARHRLSGFFLVYRDLQELATEVAGEVREKERRREGEKERRRERETERRREGEMVTPSLHLSVSPSHYPPPGRGRGSSVSSIICYLIGLSHVDPVRNGLFFRRFLNEDLQAVPDIDLDFAREIREQLILRVYERYGHDHAALVCSFATYRLRSAVRDLGKVLGLPPAAIDKLARLSEGGKAGTVRAELTRIPEVRGLRFEVRGGPTSNLQPPTSLEPSNLEPRTSLWDHLVELAEQVDGFPRHVGQHVGGMIISSRPLIELVPVQPAAMEGRFICQWDKDSCDDARFIKIDFLALGMLSLVEECLELIWQHRGERVDLSTISHDDPAVYDDICRGDTVGMFQIESRAQIQMLTRTRPRNLDDLAVQVAIVRPGPIVGGAVNPYVSRRERLRTDPTYKPRADHPMLDRLLADTLGIVLYQDQVLEVAIEMGGFTPGQADRFRRAMSRRRSSAAMESFREQFVQGARAQNVEERDARAVFEKLQAFSEFGFPKSHAYAFAVLAYQSAWLRHYYPAEYYAALFNNQPMGFYSPHVLVGDARRHGVRVLRASINRSGVKCVPEGHLLLGLTTVKGVGEKLAREIVAEREANGPYCSLPDLLRRTGLPCLAAERLIAVGALGEFGLSRRELLWQLGLVLPQRQSKVPGSKSQVQSPKSKVAGRGTLDLGRRTWDLGLWTWDLGLWTWDSLEHDMVSLKDMTTWERTVTDYKLLGLSPSYHPLALVRDRLPPEVVPAAELRELQDGARASTAGLVVCRQRPGTAKGFVFLLLEDETGLVNVVVQPQLYEAERSVVRGEPYVWVEGVVQLRSGSLNLLAARVAPLRLRDEETLEPDDARWEQPTRPVAQPPLFRASPSLRLPLAVQRSLPPPASRDFH